MREWLAGLVGAGLSAKRARKAHQVLGQVLDIDPRYSTPIRFAAYTGLRPCELVALRVGRLDLPRGTVRVAEAAPEVAGREDLHSRALKDWRAGDMCPHGGPAVVQLQKGAGK